METESVSSILDRHDTDKNSQHHHYGRHYDALLAPYRNKKIKVLEIGIFRGGSLKAWRDVFPNAETIVGIDIDPQKAHFQDESNGIYVEIGNQEDASFLRRVHDQHGPFDFIIDDGSHFNRHVIKSFEALFPLLADHGLYIVEDTSVIFSKQYQDPEYPDQVSYFTKFLPWINQCRFHSTSGVKDMCCDPFKILKTSDDELEIGIDQIHFGQGHVAINKVVRYHWRVKSD